MLNQPNNHLYQMGGWITLDERVIVQENRRPLKNSFIQKGVVKKEVQMVHRATSVTAGVAEQPIKSLDGKF